MNGLNQPTEKTDMQTNPRREKMSWHAGLMREFGLRSCCRCRGGRDRKMQTFYRVQHRETKIGPYHHVNPMLHHEVMMDGGKRIGMYDVLWRARVSPSDGDSLRCGFKSIKDLRRWFPPDVLLPLVREHGFEIVKVRGTLVAKANRGYNSVVFRPGEN